MVIHSGITIHNGNCGIIVFIDHSEIAVFSQHVLEPLGKKGLSPL